MHTTKLANNVTLIRYPCVGQGPDVCGTVAFWQQPLSEMEAMTPGLTSGLTVEVYHMDSAEMEQKVKDKIVSMHDFDLNTPGCQVAAELYFNAGEGAVHIGLFPDFWRPEDPPQERPLPPGAKVQGKRVLSHGLGHHHASESGFTGTAYTIETELTRLYRQFRSWQTQNEHENWAEDFHALLGANDARGKFSDGRPWTPASKPELYALLRGALWARRNLTTIDTSDYQAWPEGRLVWQEWVWVWDWAKWQYLRQSNGWRCIDTNLQVWRWAGSAGWIK